MNPKELAWAAGFYDGEGSTCGAARPGRERGTRIIMSITQGHREVLDRFRAAVGVGNVTGPHYVDKKHPSIPRWSWTSQNWRDCQVAYAKLWRFLSTVKREQIKKAVAASRSREWGLPVGRPKAAA